jgi:hypothetical protein
MNMHKGLLSKLAQVIEQIPRDVLYDFCCSYAESHEELAMALVNVGTGGRVPVSRIIGVSNNQ